VPRKLIHENLRVEVTPRHPGDYGFFSISGEQRSEKEERDACEDIAEQIRRHVDGIPSRGDRGVTVLSDAKTVCAFCGADWETVSVEYNGGCCDADEAAHVKALEESPCQP
jgi:hypothetical protein